MNTAPQQLGARLAQLRTTLGWTQQELAERIGVSRVAISHFELGLQLPSERTVALLASVFGLEPADVVTGTSYPPAKAERLPAVVARFTAVEHELGLLARDLEWIERVAPLPRGPSLAHETLHEWRTRLCALLDSAPDRRAEQKVKAALDAVHVRLARLPHPEHRARNTEHGT